MEAVTFQHYIERQALISHEDACKEIPGGVLLTEEDYLLGLFDCTGEMMRWAITNLSAANMMLDTSSAEEATDEERSNILTDMRHLRSLLESLNVGTGGGFLARDYDKKSEVMRTCVEKVENAVYGMIVRGKERPAGWTPGLDDGGRADAGEVY